MPAPRKFTGVLLVVLALGAAALWRLGASHPASSGDAEGAAVPVTLAKVEHRDVPVYLTGLGKVQALNTVTLRPQVDGQIVAMSLREGQDVRKGEVLVQIDSRPYEAARQQAAGKKAQDEAQLRNARKMLDRDRELVAKGMVNQQTYDQQEADTAGLEALVQTDAAAVAKAEVDLGFTRIVSPIDGRVGLRQVDPGNIVRAADGTGLAVVTQVRPIAIVFSLPDRDLSRLGAQLSGGASHATVLATERGTGEVLAEGELVAIDNQIDPATGTIRLKAEFKNDALKLWPGQFVDVRLLLSTIRRAVVVPTVAIQQGPNGAYVFVASRERRAELRPVTISAAIRGQSVVASGLSEGEEVVTDGQYLLRAHARLREVR
jgi:multidrug efflux system membrane fusion protein